MRRRSPRLATAVGLLALTVPLAARAAVNAWTPIGPPGRHGLTLDASHPFSVAVDPRSASVLFAAAPDGLYRSLDGGGHWTVVDRQLRTHRVVVDPTDSRIVYAAGEGSGVPLQSGVIKSTDGGDTWTLTSLGRSTYDLATGTTPGTLYALGSFEVFRSSDGGATWQGSATGFESVLGGVALEAPSTVLVASGKGVHRSTDGGRTFDLVLPTPDGQTPALAAAADGSVAYAGWNDQLSRSTNGGETWTPPTTLTRPYLDALAVDPSNPAVVYASLSPVGLLKSVDGGDGWSDIGAGAQDPLPPPPFDLERWTAVTIDPHDPAVLYLPSSVQGVLRSTDGGVTWSPLGVSRSWVGLLAHDPRRPGTLFAQSLEGLFRTTNDGAEWTRMALPFDFHASALAFDPGNADRLYAGGGNSVFRTTTGGDVWDGASLNRPAFEGASALVVYPQQPSTVHAATCAFPQSADLGGVFRSDDAGATWPPGVVFPPPAFARCVLALVADPGPPAVLNAGGRGGVFASMDGGVSWTPTGEAMENTTVIRLARDPGDPSRLHAVRTSPFHELVTSADRGATWRRIGTDLPPVAIHDLIVDPVDPSMLYVATELGVYVSRTAGEHFTTAGLAVSVATLALDPAPPRTLWAGVQRQGVLRHRATATCSAAPECEEGDVCTTDRCEPTSDRADLDGCVHDRSELPGVRCALDDALMRVPCSSPQPRIERRIDATLKRAREFVDRAATASRPRRRTIFMRRAKRTLSRLVRRLDDIDGPSVCVDEVRDRIVGIRSTLQALLDTGA